MIVSELISIQLEFQRRNTVEREEEEMMKAVGRIRNVDNIEAAMAKSALLSFPHSPQKRIKKIKIRSNFIIC